jgi:hypothetical protein
MRGWPSWVVESVAWWGACWGVWLVSLSAVSGQDLAVSAAASIPCGILAAVGRRAAGNRWSFRLSWFRPILKLPFAVVSDSLQVLGKAATGHRPAGELKSVGVASASGSSSLAAGRRALSTVLICTTPASVVIDFDVDAGDSRVHVLPTRGPNMLEEVAG